MNIAFDARWIFPRISGIGAYCRELLAAFARLDSPHRFTVFFDRADILHRTAREAALEGHPRFSLQTVPWGVFSLRGQFAFAARLRRDRYDVYHAPNYMIPLPAFPRGRAGRPRAVVTIHDVIPLLFPDHAPRSRKSRLFFLYRWLMREVARRADCILSVSAASRADCMVRLGIPDTRGNRVLAVHNGVSPRFVPPPGGRAAKPPEAARTVLYVGRADPYKNLPALVEAFARARTHAPFPLRLVIAGPRDDRYPEAPARARRLQVADAVSWTGYLSDADLVRAYQEADLLVLPSRYEGFGLPVVEAMACGTPVVCGPAAALREIAADAALYADPADPDAFARTLLDPLVRPDLAARLSAAGLARAATFTWDRAAAGTLAAYSFAHALPES